MRKDAPTPSHDVGLDQTEQLVKRPLITRAGNKSELLDSFGSFGGFHPRNGRPPKSGTMDSMDASSQSLSSWLANPPRPCAFVLSGGGAYGAVQVGMLKALFDAGARPDLVVGSSVGALNGSMVALDPEGSVDRLVDVWRGASLDSVFTGERRTPVGVGMVTQLARSRTSIFSDRQLIALIERHAPANTFSELSLPFTAMVTDRLTGVARPISDGRLSRALAASAAIPGVLPPVDIDGTSYVDGGMMAMFPTRQARAMGAESIVLLDATPSDPRPAPPEGLVDGLIHTLALMVRAQRPPAVDATAIGCPIVDLPSATPPEVTAFDFNRTHQLINDGYHRTRGFLERGIDDVFGQTSPS